MMSAALETAPRGANSLRNYYFLRAVVGAAWVAAAFLVGRTSPAVAAVLLVAYPAWDAVANLIDARAGGGLGRNPTQALNLAVSAAVALGVAVLAGDPHAVLALFGGWAILAGLLQLATGVRRWKTARGQWVMLLSGAQSALAGGFMLTVAFGTKTPGIADVAPYAALGAFYFLLSAVWLAVANARRG